MVKMDLQCDALFHDRYRLLRKQGNGSFGQVWLARDERLDLEVALKVYISLDAHGIEEFKQEYKTVYNLNHPNLLHANYYDVYDNRPYLVMPFCPCSAVSLIGTTDEPTAWRFIREVGGGLAYLHAEDIVHRDIKPDNILMNPDGRFLITDFGISMRLRSTLRRNSTRQQKNHDVSGTIGYMAPELFSKNPEAVKATDIWALGAALYEMLSGELPFMGQGGVLQLHGAEVPELKGSFSTELKRTVAACLSADTWQRPTAEELTACAEAKSVGKEVPWLGRIEKTTTVITERTEHSSAPPENISNEDNISNKLPLFRDANWMTVITIVWILLVLGAIGVAVYCNLMRKVTFI